MIKIRGVAFYPTVIESVLERWPQFTSEYLLVLDRMGNKEKATLRVERGASDPGKDDLKEKLERDLKVATGLSIEAELLEHGELKRVLNMEERIKAKRVWDRRG
jgi:phenylacetate-coenzyme A ligase PaaK-like adenylate-forming protein